jgi:hypothetical protein
LPSQLPLLFSYQASGRIWQIKSDLTSNCLAIEVRDHLQEVSFSYVCLPDASVIFEGLILEGGMLTNLLACYQQTLLFQQFDDLENPAGATTIALDATTQTVSWAVEAYRHYFFAGMESFGKTGEEGVQEVWSAIHLKEGVVRAVEETEVQARLREHYSRSEAEGIQLPASYQQGEEHFKTVADFIILYLQLEPVKSCEYLHVFDKMVISFYTAGGEKMENHLVVFDAEGALLLHQIIARELNQPGSETFMVWNQQLFFIENSSCLKGYNLQ